MSKLNFVLALNLTTASVLAQQIPQDSPAATFRSQSDLVLVPFHVARAGLYVSDLKAADVMLLEDGRPRDFSVFEAPARRSTPLELVLLFETTTSPMGVYWNLEDIYDFTNKWDATMSEAVMERGTFDVRASVYHFDGAFLERLCRPTSDPKEFLTAIQRLLTPIPIYSDKMTPSQRRQVEVAMHTLMSNGRWRPQMWDQSGAVAAGESIPLELPPGRKIRDGAGWPGTGRRSWPLEAAIGTLKDAATSSGHVSRMLVMFSPGGEGNNGMLGAGTTTMPEDVAEQALALGIAIYPVFTHSSAVPHNRLGAHLNPIPGVMEQMAVSFPKVTLGRLAELTGGRAFVPPLEINEGMLTAGGVRDILKAVRNDGLSQYLVGFVPQPSSRAPKEHKLEIKLASKSSGELMGGKRKTTY